MVTKVAEETYELKREDMTSEADIEPGKGLTEWDELYRYKVPVGYNYLLSRGSTLSLYLQYLQEAVGGCVADDGGTQTNETVDANEATANDVVLLATPMAVDDALYIGASYPFSLTRIKYSTRGDGVGTVTWEYWNGTAWAALSGVTDGTSNFSVAAGTYNVSWTVPTNWAKTTVLGFSLYWVRARVSAVTTAGTAATTGDQLWIYAAATEVRVTDLVKLEARDESENNRTPLLQARYSQLKEFQDVDLKAHLSLDEELVIPEGKWLVILGQPTAGVWDASASYLVLTTKRFRSAIW